tara:strand:- start:15800 stop:17170 length:1371 start_codon:yes stop_codon:yes gene_type:complete
MTSKLFGYEILWISLLTIIFAYLSFTFSEHFFLLFSMFSLITIGLVFLFYLIRIEGRLEVFDAGAILIAITILYSFFPLLSFAVNGFEVNIFTEGRLRSYRISSQEMAAHSVNHLIYIFALTLSYMYFRPQKNLISFENQSFEPINSSEIFIGILFYIALNVALTLLLYAFPEDPPYFVRQILNNFSALTFVMSIWFFALTLINRKNKFFASLLFIYLFYEFAKVILGLSGRSWFFIHMLGLFFLYHRIVKPFSGSQIFYIFLIALSSFLLFGYIRTGQAAILSVAGFFTGNEEFSSLFATSYDLKIRLQEFSINETVPFSVTNFDYIALIPSQFLPFEKIDGPSWYIRLIGLQGTGYGAGFGVISQSIVGFGKLELIIRGILIGFIFSFLHRFVTRRKISIWRLVIYTYFAIQSYHIMRNGTGYLLYFFVYFILPCFFILKFFSFSSRRFSKVDN